MAEKASLVSIAVQQTLQQSGLTSLSVSSSGSVIVTTNANSIIQPKAALSDTQGGGAGVRA
jgi:hypothetical protein